MAASQALLRGLLSLVWLALCFAPGLASAQITLDRYHPAPVASDGFALSRPDAHGHLKAGAQLQLDYARNPLVYETQLGDSATVTSRIVHKHLVGHVLASFSLYDRGLLYVHVPVSFMMSGDRLPALSADGAGLGNIGIGGRVRVLGDVHSVFMLGVQGSLGLPSSNWADARSQFQGEDKPTGRISVLADVHPIQILHVTGNVGASFRKAKFLDSYEVNQELIYGLGASVDALRGDTRLAVYLEWYGATSFTDFGKREESPMEALLGLKAFRKEGFMAGVAGGGGLVNGVGTPDWRVIGALGYLQPFDHKRAEPVVQSADRDGDGILDANDDCPAQAEDADGFEDADGCPDPDNDHDDILDAVDRCVVEAEDRDAFEDEDGCPDPDNDGDGILDVNDKCPTDAEDKDGFQDDDGCPDPDNDGDGVPDVKDQCPLEAENMNGRDDDDGCPDKIRVDRETNQIQILEPVRFATNSATILPASFEMLTEIAEVLKAHPEIAMLGVEGHTDSRGNDAKNQKLSDARANSVRDFLLSAGIDPARIVARGYGETRPLASNDNEAGRQQNRRVEFHIGGVSE